MKFQNTFYAKFQKSYLIFKTGFENLQGKYFDIL